MKLWGRILRSLRTGMAASAPPPDLTDASSDADLADWARELGVEKDVMQRMVDQRRALVQEVASDPRGWGFDLLDARAPRKNVTDEYRRHTLLGGSLGESFLQAHAPLLHLVPDPPTMPDGTALDEQLMRAARLEQEPAAAIAAHLRTTIQATLGEPLDRAAIEHAVREVAWDHDLEAAKVSTSVLYAMRDLLL